MFSVIKKKIEKFNEPTVNDNPAAFATIMDSYLIYIIVMFVLFLFAVYLSFKCNKGLNFIDLLFAFFCTPCYLFYRLVLGCNNN